MSNGRTARDDFHAHLDVCNRCANQPFNLCEIGGTLLRATNVDVEAVEVAAKTAKETGGSDGECG